MSIGQTKRIRRGIMAALQPLTGTRSTGTALVHATGGNVTLPRGSFCLPVVTSAAGKSELAHELPLWVTADTTVTAAGTSVPVASLLGGARHNLANGSVVRWDPLRTGIEPASALSSALTGGANPAASFAGAVQSIIPYETLQSAEAAQDLFNARVADTPAVVIAWDGSGPSEGRGSGVYRRSDRWQLYVVTAMRSNALTRGDEGLEVLDAIEGYLVDRAAADKMPFSGPPTEILSRTRYRPTATSFIYILTIATHAAVERIEARSLGVDYATWVTDHLDVSTATVPPLPAVADAEWPHS